MLDLTNLIINSLWLVLPAYFANFFPVILKGKKPLDLNKHFIDNKRIFGDGKTIEGFFGGLSMGLFIGIFQIYAQAFIPLSLLQFQHSPITIFLLSFGAMTGDLIGSFVKRRFSLERGRPAPLLDQLDFLIFGLILLSLTTHICISTVAFLVIITPLFHVISNIFAFLFKLKDNPW
ncbi:MAG: hypothetical protein B6U88_01795 [Candidatus Aenigmarchaeota archaeon ex4484_56]|nr:MAG: hypothetical protein B6U88_01795 [Candidatus Aenigmarchaeota archaeon ex4484_56]